MTKTKFIISALLAFALMSNANAQTDWHHYPYTPSGSLISFATDEGVHSDASVTMEWWYLNFMLVGGVNDIYTGMLCYFRPLPLRIFNIGNVSTGEFYENAIPALGSYTFATGHLQLTYDYSLSDIHDFWRWTYPDDSATFKYVLFAENPGDGCALNLTITSNKSPLIVGGNGWVGLGDTGDSSFYYSLSNMRVTGSVDCGFWHDTITSGIVWLDRQWGPFIVNPESQYEWFSIQVDRIGATIGSPTSSSAEFNIWQLFADTSFLPSGPTGYMSNMRIGDSFSDTTSQFIFERLAYWKDPDGERYFSHGWRYIDTLHNTCLEFFPMLENQMVTVAIMHYWEGGCFCSGIANGIDVEGVAFAELPRRTSHDIDPPDAPTSLSGTPSSGHVVLTWHSAVPGTYPIGGYRLYRASGTRVYGNYIATTNDTFFVDLTPPAGSIRYWVSSFDNQTGVSASRHAGPVVVSTVGIENDDKIIEGFVIGAFPNPFNSSCEISVLGSRFSVCEIKIFDIEGKLVEGLGEPNTENRTPITKFIWHPAPSISSGIYLVRATATNGQVIAKRIVYMK